MNDSQTPPPGEESPGTSVPRPCSSWTQRLLAWPIIGFARLLTGARSLWRGCAPEARQRVYFANHSSHADFVLLWSSLPPALRMRTRPVAGADYWLRDRLRRFLIQRVFHGVLVDRELRDRHSNPLQPLLDALAGGDSLILFPEGTRNPAEGLLPFRSGLYRLARDCPQVELVPVWIANLNRVMPKGRVLPLPLLCTVTFGAPLSLDSGERKEEFLARAREALLNLAVEAA
ncbi:phospholipid/glycerol acyltransferase [Azotobacter vinelandii CA]|uniref:Phospholipid/glycerol acyltransferase n=2 Tax=Azotobacter vinelandii TaxID=354 RepID=C1DKJ3_AZOVD|nr:lysophospholipid acyltransferase family protein [Azotobacter vinelandii]ACO76856.1 phospholipid/glycerol acyltransferase [Azotobacter vinelandii DJ]AGK15555.1 phospholipid/glycerol acyltransferase [Azotobacter vinelandii CA]AGK19421.1 phospholipid/glycerol acyltransferase [Azotobacter vinelandii CA6]WKN22606.1 1-acyl-sn-glycerol-3-phosphate acyltransferase [Azotobacter vinelandii]SFX66743.1 1-acyl-sn-glycerol-3-phosphate acyltransferase [Azotobacter vinelandii]